MNKKDYSTAFSNRKSNALQSTARFIVKYLTKAELRCSPKQRKSLFLLLIISCCVVNIYTLFTPTKLLHSLNASTGISLLYPQMDPGNTVAITDTSTINEIVAAYDSLGNSTGGREKLKMLYRLRPLLKDSIAQYRKILNK